MCHAVKKSPLFSPNGRWCDTGGDFCQRLFQECVLGKVEQCVKQHFNHVTVKSSSENNANELPWNSFSTMSVELFFFFFNLTTNASNIEFKRHRAEISLSSLLAFFFPSLYKVSSRGQWQEPDRIRAGASLQHGISLHRVQEEITLCSHQRRFV